MTAKRKPKSLSDPRHVAIHEAGHAVIGRVLTLVCGDASIVANDYSYGRSALHNYEICEEEWAKRGKRRGIAKNRMRAALHASIITATAGVEAEQELIGCSVDDSSGDADMALVAELAFDFHVSWTCEPRLRAMTRMLVRRHRHRVERVADALIAKGKLTTKQLDRLVGRSVNDVNDVRGGA